LFKTADLATQGQPTHDLGLRANVPVAHDVCPETVADSSLHALAGTARRGFYSGVFGQSRIQSVQWRSQSQCAARITPILLSLRRIRSPATRECNPASARDPV